MKELKTLLTIFDYTAILYIFLLFSAMKVRI